MSKKTPPPFFPSVEQLEAVEAFRTKYSERRLLKARGFDDWVDALQCAWAQGWDDREPGGGYLRQVRNTPGGHEWLREQRKKVQRVQNLKLIMAPGRFPSIPVPQRVDHSNATRYEWATIPVMDKREEAYAVELSVRAADPDAEQALAEYLSQAVNAYPMLVGALLSAYTALDSVAFLQSEGDTDDVKRSLLEVMVKAGCTNELLGLCAIKK